MIELEEIQRHLAATSVDGWLLYDFQGINPVAARVAGLGEKMLTRRWFCLIPRQGNPEWLVNQIERQQFADVEGVVRTFSTWQQLVSGLSSLLQGRSRVAMEYSPGGTIPYVSRVDAGTLEIVRNTGCAVVSSADLVQWCEARLSASALATHLYAAKHLETAKEAAFEFIFRQMEAGKRISEYDIQQEIIRYFDLHGLVTSSPPIVAAAQNTSDPHYQPTSSRAKLLEEGDLVLVDLWAKTRDPGAVYADITWMAHVSDSVPDELARVFAAVVRARDAAIDFLKRSVARGDIVLGYEVDDVARGSVTKDGYGDRFIHRTGHNIGTEDHGRGVNFDNYETHDDRRVIPNITCSIEPGLYFGFFGMRTEVNVHIGARSVEVSTVPMQRQIIPLQRHFLREATSPSEGL